jgi:demethylspheroidene O-methyltransferase
VELFEMGSLADRWLALRDRILSDARFQRFASTSWWLAPIAQRRASRLFDLCAGFVYSQILQACVHLDLFARLKRGPLAADALATEIGLPLEEIQILLRAASALELVETRAGERYGLGVHGAAILANPGIAAMIAHHGALYRDLEDPVRLLRGAHGVGELSRYWSYVAAEGGAGLSEAQVAPYTALMSASQSLIASQVLASYSFRDVRRLLDIGGGDATFLSAVGRRWPHLQLQLFDLPAVAQRARHRFEADGLTQRAQAFGGDFFSDALPRGADAASFVRVLHDHDDGSAIQLLLRAREALGSGGLLLVAEPLAGTRGARRMGDAYFGFYLMAMGSGRPRRYDELKMIIERAGFRQVRKVRTPLPLQTSLIVARV